MDNYLMVNEEIDQSVKLNGTTWVSINNLEWVSHCNIWVNETITKCIQYCVFRKMIWMRNTVNP